MKKQLYRIEKFDWVVSNRNLGVTLYKYFKTLKDAKAYAKNSRGRLQFFKISYEFKDAQEG